MPSTDKRVYIIVFDDEKNKKRDVSKNAYHRHDNTAMKVRFFFSFLSFLSLPLSFSLSLSLYFSPRELNTFLTPRLTRDRPRDDESIDRCKSTTRNGRFRRLGCPGRSPVGRRAIYDKLKGRLTDIKTIYDGIRFLFYYQ